MALKGSKPSSKVPNDSEMLGLTPSGHLVSSSFGTCSSSNKTIPTVVISSPRPGMQTTTSETARSPGVAAAEAPQAGAGMPDLSLGSSLVTTRATRPDPRALSRVAPMSRETGPLGPQHIFDRPEAPPRVNPVLAFFRRFCCGANAATVAVRPDEPGG